MHLFRRRLHFPAAEEALGLARRRVAAVARNAIRTVHGTAQTSREPRRSAPDIPIRGRVDARLATDANRIPAKRIFSEANLF